MPQGYIKEATYQFSDLYLPGKSSNSWGRGGQTKRDTLTNKQTECSFIYIDCIPCLHCNAQYIGESEKSLAIRFGQHKGYVRNKNFEQATGSHFNQRGHCMSDMQVLILEKIHSTDGAYRKEREKMYINLFNTSYKGMNKQM